MPGAYLRAGIRKIYSRASIPYGDTRTLPANSVVQQREAAGDVVPGKMTDPALRVVEEPDSSKGREIGAGDESASVAGPRRLARKYRNDIQASQAAPNILTTVTSQGHLATTDPRPNTADDINIAKPRRTPPRCGNDRCQPNNAPEDISSRLFGPGVSALINANPVRLTSSVESMQLNRVL